MAQNNQSIRWRKILQNVLGILIIICFLASGFFLWRHFDNINSQYDNAKVAINNAERVIKNGTDFRTDKPKVGDAIGTIRIEGLTDEMPLIEGDDLNDAMAHGVGHIPQTPLPGTFSGEPAVSAHRETFFKPLKDAKEGDIVVITMPYGTYRYEIYKSFVFDPDEWPTTDETINKERLLLITCYPFNAWQSPDKRIAFFANLIE